MATTSSDSLASDSLLRHLPSVYALAQVVTPDAEAAARLVEATYRRAFDDAAAGKQPSKPDAPSHPEAAPGTQDAPDAPGTKEHLLRLLLETRKTDATAPSKEAEGESAGNGASPGASGAALQALRERLALHAVERAFPKVFATLPGGARVLLLLCEVEGLTCEAASRVMGLSPDEACARLEHAKEAARSALRGEVTVRERYLIDTCLPDTWLPDALRQAVATDLAALPPTLEPALRRRRYGTRQAPPRARPAPRPSTRPNRLVRLGFAVLLILTVGLIGVFVSRLLSSEPESDLIVLSVEQAPSAEAVLETNRPDRAEAFVESQFDWALTLPSIEQATLLGVGTTEITDGTRVPVFLYRDDLTGETLTLYAFTYALLRSDDTRLRLAPDILRQIETDRHFDLHDLGERRVLVWRYRDDIFVAVTEGNAEALQQRIVFPA